MPRKVLALVSTLAIAAASAAPAVAASHTAAQSAQRAHVTGVVLEARAKVVRVQTAHGTVRSFHVTGRLVSALRRGDRVSLALTGPTTAVVSAVVAPYVGKRARLAHIAAAGPV